MEFSKSIILLFLASSFLLSTDAHRMASGPSSNSPQSPIKPRHPKVCKKLVSPHLDLPIKLPTIINPVLKNICGVTENSTNCIALIFPCITGSTNPFSALEAVIVSLIEHVEHTLSFSLKLVKNKSTKAEIVTALNLSTEIYVKVIEDLKKALAAFKAQDNVTVRTMLVAAITEVGRCDEAFQQHGLTKTWPLFKIDHMLTQLAGFGLDIHGKFIIKVD
ncbi:uncharacterized protein LOC126681438 [Mercurialis annua]|uniref:uncharacterized protein LOC126681438 n=1 Tax=Mercurialis annua TaxID=3986 RepID=UPI00215F59A0|nr:uncharacterized protein LOC126681438 [Mercurialis annua]